MPNGGSDCCGTCWFNAKNKGEAGYDHTRDPEPDFCTIRGFAIPDSFYTYCGNHPHRRPEKDRIAIGPVFVGTDRGDREISRPSPDTEEIRQHLLDLLSQIQESPAKEYPIGVYEDDLVVWQVGEFREVRSIEELRRIAAFSPGVKGLFGRTRHNLVTLAKEALLKIEGKNT
jgi:hypothetical protein